MFGRRFYGGRYYGPRYWGDGGTGGTPTVSGTDRVIYVASEDRSMSADTETRVLTAVPT